MPCAWNGKTWKHCQRIYQKVPQWGGQAMFKKMILGGLVMMAAGTFVFGRGAFSYVKTVGQEIRQTVKSQVPLDFEVRRAQQVVEDLVPEIRKAMHVIAEQQVEVEALEQAVSRRDVGLKQQKEAILALRGNLAEGETQFVIAGKSYSQQQVEKDLENRFRRFRLAEETLAHEQQILTARKAALQSNEEQLATLISTKRELEAELAQLDARMRAVQAAEAVTKGTPLDDRPLNRAKSLIAELNKQLDVKERLLEAGYPGAGMIPIEQEMNPKLDISQEVDNYFQRELADQTL